jgi:uncharacterized protein (TIRG00374 family)
MRIILYVLLPIVLLTIILTHIDLSELKANIGKTDVRLLVMGVCLQPLVTMVGAIRWRSVVRSYLNEKPPLGHMLRHYWIGLCLGLVAPGPLGMDVYRVAVVGRRFGGFLRGFMVILAEKTLALANVVALIVLLFPAVSHLVVAERTLTRRVYWSAVVVLSLLTGAVGVLALIKKGTVGRALWRPTQRYLTDRIRRIGAVLKRPVRLDPDSLTYGNLVRPVLRPKVIGEVLFLSTAILFLSACVNQVFFQSIGYDIPFLINLFIAPVLFFVLTLPVSFGNLGIREGAYVLLHGAFGVPAEVALLVGFFNFTGFVLNCLIGAVLIWVGDGIGEDPGSKESA